MFIASLHPRRDFKKQPERSVLKHRTIRIYCACSLCSLRLIFSGAV